MVESPALFECELSPINVWLFVMQSLVRALPNDERVLSAHTKAILLKNIDLVRGMIQWGKKGGQERRKLM